ncbi:hypothetical protein PRUPE_3G071100 [Prunus persica]|uniref:Major facilitator superfamily (MFS) profile domain-containing protein n=1 Tax=Prunus persica TaxID=3760 RepID=M5WVN2_PRUPE|nr:polyol transporter 5 [Prunus persica]ONI15957.1 hypothetical protein PRUPE_3G071100 [Prunus persica]
MTKTYLVPQSPNPSKRNLLLIHGLGVNAMWQFVDLLRHVTPLWLVMQGRLGNAKHVLDKTSDSVEEAQLRLADIKEAAGIPEHCTEDVVQVPKHSHGEEVWKELLLHPTPPVRHILMAAVGFHFFQQMSGIDAHVLYSPRIFEKAGITDSSMLLLATVAVGFSKTVFTLIAIGFLDRVGRSPLLLTSVAGMIASLFCLGTSLTIVDHEYEKMMWASVLCLTMVLAYVGFFSIGMGPIAWVYSSEIFPLKLRAQGCSMGSVPQPQKPSLSSGAVKVDEVANTIFRCLWDMWLGLQWLWWKDYVVGHE